MNLSEFGRLACVSLVLDCGTQADWGAHPCSLLPPGVTIGPPSATLAVAESLRFVATQWTLGDGCAFIPLNSGTFEWAVSDTAVARLAGDSGLVVGMSPGAAMVTARATNGAGAAGAAVTVVPATATKHAPQHRSLLAGGWGSRRGQRAYLEGAKPPPAAVCMSRLQR